MDTVRKSSTVVLFSGGLDSLLAALLAERNEDGLLCLTIDYGQNKQEQRAARELCQHYGWKQMTAKVTPFPHSTDPNGTNLIPGRNAMFLSLAAATMVNGKIYVGCNADDNRDYPDCREEFFTAYQRMLSVQGREIIIKKPLINLSKAEVVTQLRKRGAPIEKTVSCYAGRGCGQCNACKLRESALA